MNNQKISYFELFLLLVGIFISACSAEEPNPDLIIETDQPIADMANPAALYCEGLGYELEAVERDGGMDADCVFPDESRCGQWDFFSGRCGQEKTYCEIQGGEIQEGANIGTCLFSDGSTCVEDQYFSGECAPGDNPGEVIEKEEDLQEEAIEIKDMNSARDYLVAYLNEQYGINSSDPWMEVNITSEDFVGVTMRYISGPLWIVISAEAAAPYSPLYDVQEVSYIANGFRWVGSVSFDGIITEIEVVEPWPVLNEEQARDAALAYLVDSYGISSPTEWVDEGSSQKGDSRVAFRYSSSSWLVTVEFAPAAPLVPSYMVVVENSDEGLRWEGEITGPGEITEISFNQ